MSISLCTPSQFYIIKDIIISEYYYQYINK